MALPSLFIPQIRPTLIRPKSIAVFPGKLGQDPLDLPCATISRVFEWSAAKWCEACTENDTGIEQIRIDNDPFTQARHGFVDHRKHQPVLQVRG